jgi:uncharacterized protein YecT (DUF1311 family)
MKTALFALLLIAFAPAFSKGLSKQYDSCMDAANGVTAGMQDCIGAETKRQDAELNRNYQTALKAVSLARKQQLTAAQRLWIAFRKANTDFIEDPDGGTAATVNASSTFMTMTQERADELSDFVESN